MRRIRRNKRSTRKKYKKIFILFCVGYLLYPFLMMHSASAFSMANALTYIRQQILNQQVNDSLKVVSSQDAASGSAMADAYSKVKQKSVEAYAMLVKKQALTQYISDFVGNSSGTQYSKCDFVTSRQNESVIPDKVNLGVNSQLNAIVNAGLLNTGDASQLNTDAQYQFACSIELDSMGVCNYTGKSAPYYNTDFSLISSSTRVNDTESQAFLSGVNSIAPLNRDKSVTLGCGKDDYQCTSKLMSDNQRVATNSLVSYSLLNQLYQKMALGGADK